MTTTTYDQFLVEVIPYVRDVPEVVAIQAVRNACIEFCEETRYLQVDNDPVALITGQSSYDLDADTGYVVIDVVEAWVGDQFLVPKSVEQLTKIYRGNDWRTMKGNPYYYYRSRMASLNLVPTPQVPSAISQSFLNCRVAVAPSRSSTSVDSDLYERFLEVIGFGARARLYGTVNQPYYDPQATLDYRKRFNDEIADVRTRVNKGLSRASVAIEFQRVV
jgi:hypothetical protein